MTTLSVNGRQAFVAAMWIVVLPLAGKTAGAMPEGTAQRKTPLVAEKAMRTAQRNSLPTAKRSKTQSTPSAKAASPKPNFYAESSTTAKKPATKGGGSSARLEKTRKAVTQGSASTVAGPSSVRRLQPANVSIETASYLPPDQTLNPRAKSLFRSSGESIPNLSPQVSADTTEKKSPWARLNPLSLFESRRPKFVPSGYIQTGIASWYGSDFHGGPTASGERYD
ncbi:MAG: hypothetical protein ACP5QZ_12560, partial [Candidatus Sumerlaeaceae bacterium]